MNKKSKKVSKNKALSGELGIDESHPSAYDARDYLVELGVDKLMTYLESYSSCALTGENRLAEICAETLQRFLYAKPVSDRYILGLAWNIKKLEDYKPTQKGEG
ncbi:MAG: hypothetical protein KBA02_00250 [Paludibacteraceae bacterium]|nr:hypothetical protein [Paludibacteraceae bacterium]